MSDKIKSTPRRSFLGTLASGAAALGLMAVASPLNLKAEPVNNNDISEADAWFKKLETKSKHRIVFDATQPKEPLMLTFAWPKVFLMTNDKTGTMEKDCGVVVVLRHDAIPYAFNDNLWASYKLGEMFKIEDPKTKAHAVRNPFWKPQPG